MMENPQNFPYMLYKIFEFTFTGPDSHILVYICAQLLSHALTLKNRV